MLLNVIVIFFSVHVIIATPGRILDLMNKNLVKTHACNMLVLDEVSICLSLPVGDEIRGNKIYSKCL